VAAFLGLGLLGLIALYFLARGFLNTDPRILARALKIVAVIAIIGLAVFLALRGRIDVAGLLALALTGFIRRWSFGLPFPFFGRNPPGGGWQKAKTGNEQAEQANGTASGADQSSGIETAWLRLRLDRASGRMDGEVLQGRHAGRRLETLDPPQLFAVLDEIRSQDAAGLPLMETYLDRRLGPEWREQAAASATPPDSQQNGMMSREQAYDVLGLSPGASEAMIREAHRRLMKKMHPDQGGSNYLAAQINRAKDILLGA